MAVVRFENYLLLGALRTLERGTSEKNYYPYGNTPPHLRSSIPYTAVCITHTPEAISHARYLHSRNIVGATKGSAALENVSPRAFRRRLVRHPIFRDRYLHSSWSSATGAKKGSGAGNISPRESFPQTHRSVLAPSWLWSNRPWKPAPGGCDKKHRRVRYTRYASTQQPKLRKV